MSSSASTTGLIETLVRTCHVRIAGQIRKRECFLALAVLLFAVCCLLLLGTRYVPVAVLPLAAGLGAWMAVKRWKLSVPGKYLVSQQIDEREELSDELATAYFFRSSGSVAVSQRVAERQYELASESARTINPESVFPNTVAPTQRSTVYFLASAALLLGLRVGVQSKLSFEPPLVPLLFESLFGFNPEPQRAHQSSLAHIDQRDVRERGITEDELGTRAEAAESSEADLPDEQRNASTRDSDELPEVEGLITLAMEEQAVESSLQESSTPTDEGSDNAVGDEPADIPTEPDADTWNDDAQSLLDKLKQAFQNMLETLDLSSIDSSDSQEGQETGSGNTEEASAAGEPAESGDPQEQMSSEAADASMEGGEPGQEAGETASAGTTSGEDSSGDQSSGENASAAGTSDGSKEFAEAEQEQVLGLLEELYMQRAERMKGDVTVETRLAEQTARVPYNQQSILHADQGGTVSRDEIPPAYRSYIQNYFEALRRNAE